MKYEYLLFNFVVLAGPILVLMFYKKVQKPKLKVSLFTILITAIVFTMWDMFFTNLVWYFNPQYTLGIHVRSVPIEEVLFFITVPFACLLLWVNMRFLPSNDRKYPLIPSVLGIVAGVLTIVSLYFQWYYSASVCFAFLVCICLDFVLETKLFQKSIFFIFLSSVNILTFIFNLYLTSRPVVTYNLLMKSNLNIITIPIEDFVYGMVLISLVIMLYERTFRKRSFR